MIRYLTGFIFLFFADLSYGQFNDSTSYVINYTTAGSINKTNDSRTYLLNNALKLGVRKKSVSLNFNNNWIYGQQNRQITNNDYSTTLDFNLYKTFPNFFYWGLANYNTSKSLKINNQLLTGLGIAYNIYDRKNAYLNISNGILYDNSDLILENGLRDKYETTRNSFRLAFKFVISDLVTLNGMSFIQNSLVNGSDYIIKSNTGASFKLNKWISFTTSYDYNKVSRTNRDNSLLSYGLTFERYF